MKNLFSLLLVCSLLVSCDPIVNIDFKVRNESGQPILIVYNSTDTSIIDHNTELKIDHMGGIGHTDETMDSLKALPFDTIFIENDSAQPYNKDPMDLSRWEQSKPDKNSAAGRVVLKVLDVDFD